MIKIQKNIPLAPFTTFKIGGPAKYFCEVKKEDDLLEAVKYAQDNKLEVFVLAGGSNVLINDDGFDGLVIRVLNIECRVQDTTIECGAGLQLSEAVKIASENSLSGLEWAAGIPGTVGGAVRGNAGAYGGSMAESVEGLRVAEISNSKTNLEIKVVDYKKSDCNFDYRSSVFKENRNLIILSCFFKLRKGEKKEIEKKTRETIGKRAEKLPKDSSAGSFFQNPVIKNPELVAKFEKDTKCVCRGERIPAGWLIDELGLRGKKMGDAMVSEKHANFVINSGQGKAADVIMLASYIKQQVRDKFGVQLQEEIQYIGF